MILMVSLHLGEQVYVYYHPGIHTQHIFQCPSFDHFPTGDDPILYCKYSNIQLDGCTWVYINLCNCKNLSHLHPRLLFHVSSKFFLLVFLMQPSLAILYPHQTVESCFKPSLSVGTTVTKSDTAAWYKNNNPTTRIFYFGHFKSSATGLRHVDTDTLFFGIHLSLEKSHFYTMTSNAICID